MATCHGMELPAVDDQQLLAASLGVIGLLAGVLVLVVRTYTEAKAGNRGGDDLAQQVANLRHDVELLAEAQRDFLKRGWQTLPDDIATAARLTETVRSLQAADAKIVDMIHELKETLHEHDRWERSEKYGS